MKNTLTIILFLTVIMCLLLFANCGDSPQKANPEQYFKEKKLQLVDMIGRQNSTFFSIV